MNTLRLNITVPSLSVLDPVGTNTYNLVVRFYSSPNVPLGSPYIPDSYTDTVTTTSTTFPVDVPVTDTEFEYNDVLIKVFANSSEDCCFAQGIFDVVNDPNAPPAPLMARSQYQGWFEHMNATAVQENSGWRIIDQKNYPLDSGYEWSYFLNEVWTKRSDNLNIFWPANTPLTIFKVQTKIGLDSLNRYDPTAAPGGYYDPTAVKPFSNNCTFSFKKFVFND
jgi:hypothetical protein